MPRRNGAACWFLGPSALAEPVSRRGARLGRAQAVQRLDLSLVSVRIGNNMESEGTHSLREVTQAAPSNTSSRIVRDYLSLMWLHVLLKFIVDVTSVSFLLALVHWLGLILCRLGGADIGISSKHITTATALLGFIYLASILAVASRRLWAVLTPRSEQRPAISPSPIASPESAK